MGFEDVYTPESEEEWELMEDLHVATRRAHRRGLSKPAIARLLAFMSSTTLAPRSLEEAEETPFNRPSEEESEEPTPGPEDAPRCPECGEIAGDAITQMGGIITVDPCGCEFQWDDREQLPDVLQERVEDR